MCEFDYRKLKGKIVEKYGTQEKLADDLGMHKNSLSLRISNKLRFTNYEILEISIKLGIPKEEIGDYFFTLRKT